jgi:hypothetical protein
MYSLSRGSLCENNLSINTGSMQQLRVIPYCENELASAHVDASIFQSLHSSEIPLASSSSWVLLGTAVLILSQLNKPVLIKFTLAFP